MAVKIKDGFMIRRVAGEYVVVPVGNTEKTFHGMIQLNVTGAFLWEQCVKETTKEQVVQALTDKYEVERDIAQKDVERFLKRLDDAGILETGSHV